MKISQKLWLVLIGLIISLGGVVGGAVTYIDRAQSQDLNVVNNADHKERLVSRWSSLTETNAARTLAVVMSLDDSIEKAFKSDMADTTARISELQKELNQSNLTDQDKVQMERIAQARQNMAAARTETVDARNAADYMIAAQLVQEKYIPASDAYLGELHEFLRMQQMAADEAMAHMKATQQKGLILEFTGLGILLALMAVGAYFLIRSIQHPLAQAADLATTIAQGDLRVQFQGSQRRDEFGVLLNKLDEMRQALANMVNEVRQSAHSMALASSEIASGNQDLSARTEATSSSLEQTAAAMVQFTSSIQQSAASANQASQLSRGASEVAQRGGSMVNEVVGTMGEIEDSSRRIAEIIGVIDGIAFQTNILALNAAVEAARAGEQGRGFAVVAGEVRILAQRSADAAKEIRDLIGASVERVENGTRLVANAGDVMNEVVHSVKGVSEMINEITAAATEQSTGVSEVNQAVGQLDQMTQQNAALVEQSAAAAAGLSDQARHLTSLVGMFQTDLTLESKRLEAVLPPVANQSPSTARLASNATSPNRASSNNLERLPAKPAALTQTAKSPQPAVKPANTQEEDDWETF